MNQSNNSEAKTACVTRTQSLFLEKHFALDSEKFSVVSRNFLDRGQEMTLRVAPKLHFGSQRVNISPAIIINIFGHSGDSHR